jgi:hypothetical protein
VQSPVERAIFGSSAPVSRQEFLDLAIIEPAQPVLDGYGYRVTFDGASVTITLRHDGTWIAPERGSRIFESRDDCAFRAARIAGLLD